MSPFQKAIVAGKHVATHIQVKRGVFVTGCTCGWRGPQRHTLQTAVADCIDHCKPFFPQVRACGNPECPIE